MTKRIADMTPAEREKRRAQARARYAANPEKMRAAQRAQYAADPVKQSGWTRAWQAAHPDQVRATQRKRHLRRWYGLTPGQYDRMFAEQSGACAVCLSPFAGQKKRPHVDHCHRTGKVRALLCSNCNTALGYARDRPDILRTLADYIEHHEK